MRKLGVNPSGSDIYSIAEFFVMKKYRKAGIGSRAANIIFNTFKGEWKIGQLESNVPAQGFLRAAGDIS